MSTPSNGRESVAWIKTTIDEFVCAVENNEIPDAHSEECAQRVRKMLFIIGPLLSLLSDFERARLFEQLSEAYCLHCAVPIPKGGQCYCQRHD